MIKLKENTTILFQGDSITDGNRGRNEDLNHIMGHGYQYIVGARLQGDNPDKNIQLYNRGISGNRISDLYGRWLEDAVNINPDILSILVGVNDIGRTYSINAGSNPVRYEKIYRLLLDEMLEKNPDVKFVLMEPFVGENFSDEEKAKIFREHVVGLQDAVRRIAKDYNAVFIPLQDMFDEYAKTVPSKELIWDGVHPTILGHELISRRWLEITAKEIF